MVSRLLLGCGAVGRAVAAELADRRGSLRVLAGEESVVENLRDDGIPAEVADVTDPAALSAFDADLVFVAGDDPSVNAAATAAAARALPDAGLLAYAPRDGSATAEIRATADAVVDPGEAVGATVLDAAESDAGVRTRRLRRALRAVDGHLAVVTHDNPDPDAIGAAIALVAIAESVGVEATACYYGEINHQENRAMVNLLDLDLRTLDPGEDLSEFDGFALVDHSRPGVNDQLPPDVAVDVVIDHHPPRAPVDGGYVDLRQEAGATSTLLVEYVSRFGLAFDERVATALLFGIRVDTDDFVREVSTHDFEAAATLLEHADLDVLQQVENPSVSGDTLETVGRAIRNRQVEGRVLTSYVGTIADRDALAQAAEELLSMEGIATTLVFGTMADVVYVSARARGARLDLGESLRLAFEQIGSAGGHADMAGAQLPLRSIAALPPSEAEDRDAIVESVITERFREVVRASPPRLGSDSGFDVGDLPDDPDAVFLGLGDRDRGEWAAGERVGDGAADERAEDGTAEEREGDGTADERAEDGAADE